jgi:hypothetical protein
MMMMMMMMMMMTTTRPRLVAVRQGFLDHFQLQVLLMILGIGFDKTSSQVPQRNKQAYP